MLVYATDEDLTDWTSQPAPDNADVLLRSASLLVGEATITARYKTDSDGYPSVKTVRGAFRDAVCAQAAAWAAAGIDPTTAGLDKGQGPVSAKSIGSASLSYAGAENTAASRVDAIYALVPDARRILAAEGLLAGRAWVYG